ncbi:MAG: hypothetical protein LBQ43_03725, partial [Holosporales bacterium]|nr:hypothetical protein [Holosporales bacterium]
KSSLFPDDTNAIIDQIYYSVRPKIQVLSFSSSRSILRMEAVYQKTIICSTPRKEYLNPLHVFAL